MIGGRIAVIGGPKAHLKKFRKFLKEALQATVEHWHEKILPQHFERSAYARYRYQRRSPAHEKRKMRLFGHQKPLVFTGRLEREVTRRIVISGSARIAKGTLRGPKWLYAYRKAYGQPDKAAEIMKTTKKEEREMGRFLDRFLEGKLNSVRTRETRRV